MLLFSSFSFQLTAQTMQVQGHLLGDEKARLLGRLHRTLLYLGYNICCRHVTANMKRLFLRCGSP